MSLLREMATGSGASRWLNCPASVALSAGIKLEEKSYATEGTEAHSEAAECLRDGRTPSNVYVGIYVDTIRSLVGDGPLVVEERLPFLQTSGQIDCYAIRGRVGYLFDFKYGLSIRLEAEENEQLAFYACALKEKYPKLKGVHCVLVQPRIEGLFEAPSILQWYLSYQSLAKWKRKFDSGLREVEKAQAIKAGPYCRFCPARGSCVVHLSYLENTQREQDLLPAEIINSDNYLPELIPRISRVLLMEDQIKNWFEKAKEFLLSVAISGKEVPGFELTRKRASRKWHTMYTEEELAEELKNRGLDDPWEKSLIPLTRAEKKVDITNLTEKPEGGLTLKRIQ